MGFDGTYQSYPSNQLDSYVFKFKFDEPKSCIHDVQQYEPRDVYSLF